MKFVSVGMASQLRREQEAIVAFQRALQLNPFHVSAEFGLARAYQHLGRQEEARKHLARFQVILLHNEHNGTFKDVRAAAGIKNASDSVSGLTWIDYDHDGDLDLYVTTDDRAGAGANVMWRPGVVSQVKSV